MVKDRPCKECGYLTQESQCPNCGSNHFLEKFKGKVLILDFKNSQVAEKLNIKSNGKFALKYG